MSERWTVHVETPEGREYVHVVTTGDEESEAIGAAVRGLPKDLVRLLGWWPTEARSDGRRVI